MEWGDVHECAGGEHPIGSANEMLRMQYNQHRFAAALKGVRCRFRLIQAVLLMHM